MGIIFGLLVTVLVGLALAAVGLPGHWVILGGTVLALRAVVRRASR